MGASRERKKRQEYYANGGVDKRAVRAAEEKAAQKRFNLLLGGGIVAFLVIAAVLIVYNNGLFSKGSGSQTAVTVGDRAFTAADYSYYHRNAYNSYYQQFGSMASYFTESFPEEAVRQMQFVTAALAAAQADGFTAPEVDAQLQEQISSAKSAAKVYGLSYKNFIAQQYGDLVTPEVFERNLRDLLTASAYAQAHTDSLTYTDAQIADAYKAAPNDYDHVDGHLVTISGTPESKTDADGNPVEPTEAETKAAMDAAEATARQILADYQAGGDLETLAKDAGAEYALQEEVSHVGGAVYSDWLFDSARKAGDADVMSSTASWYVVVFTGRSRDETHAVNVRHILLTSDSLAAPGASDEETDALVKKAAEDLLATWDGTEEGFAALAEANTKDSGSAANGGLYENITPATNFVPEFLDWCFADGRKAGDTGIISTTHGWHIMYLSEITGTTAWQEAVRQDLLNADAAAWEEELVKDYEPVRDEAVLRRVTPESFPADDSGSTGDDGSDTGDDGSNAG